MIAQENERKRLWWKNNPWAKPLALARSRCNFTYDTSYHRYGGRGITIDLTMAQIKEMWFRDGADKMDRPSLDRIDSKGNYTFNNCRFIEYF